MTRTLIAGTKVKQAWTGDGPGWKIGEFGIKSMIITMENGQMEGVPWIRICFEDKKETLINCAALEGLELDIEGTE